MSDKYNEVKVFTLTDEFGVVGVYSCRGVVCNTIHQWAYSLQKEARIEEGRLLFHGDKPISGEYLYRCTDAARGSNKSTSWYPTEMEAQEAAKRMRLMPSYSHDGGDVYSEDQARFSTEEIDPIDKVVRVKFERDDKGRLFTRLNAHPEWDGDTPQERSKIFFPDKSFDLADVGEAIVSIAKELDTFGFLTGEMVKFEDKTLTKSAILDWAWDKGYAAQELVVINHPARGRYYAMFDGEDYERITQFYDYTEKENYIYTDTPFYEGEVVKQDIDHYTESRATFLQLFMEDVWGTELDTAKIEAMFKPSEFYEESNHVVHWDKSLKLHSKAIDAAVKSGALSQYVAHGLHIEVVTYNYSVFALMTLSVDEVKSLAAEVSAINAKADEAAKNLRRKGKLRW